MRLHAAFIAALCPCTLAVFADEAYRADFHHALVGLPRSSTTFFHQPYSGSKASLLYTLSEKAVLGALNPKDGTIVWRQHLSAHGGPNTGLLKPGKDQDTIVSAVNDTVSAWSAADGRLVWDQICNVGIIQDLVVSDFSSVHNVTTLKNAIVILGEDGTVQLLDGQTGLSRWTHQDDSGAFPCKIAATPAIIYSISLQSTLLSGWKIKVTSLDPATGAKVDQYTLASDSDVSSPDDIVFVGGSSTTPFVLWTDRGHRVLKLSVLGSEAIESLDVRESRGKIKDITVHTTQQSHQPHFLVHYQGPDYHWAEVFHINSQTSYVSKAYDLPRFSGEGSFSASVVDGNIYFIRMTSDAMTLVSSVSQDVLGSWPVNAFHSPNEKPFPVHATTEVVARPGRTFAARTAVLSSSGDWSLIRDAETSWTRMESLAGIVKAEWMEFHEGDSLTHDLEEEQHSNMVSAYIHRFRRHIYYLDILPALLRNLPRAVLKRISSTGSAATEQKVENDIYGQNKLVVVATDNGRIIGLDFGNSGRPLWNLDARGCNVQSNPEPEEQWNVSSVGSVYERLICLRESATLQDLLINATNSTKITEVISHAKDIKPVSKPTAINAGEVKGENAEIKYGFTNSQLYGYNQGRQVWRFVPRPGQHIVSVTPRLEHEPVASIGKVLWNRKVLYKYLNPSSVIVVAVNDEQRMASIYVVDATVGTLLYTADHTNVDNSRQGASVISENWIAYSFTTDPSSPTSSKGYQLVVAEMYESPIPNDRGLLGASINSTSPQSITPHVISQIFHVPGEISSMAVTQTGQGITSRQLLVSLAQSNSIVAIPRQAIDPRRTIGKDPTSAEQMEEGLSRYSPVIDFDPRWYLNHKQEVVGVQKIITTPAQLESTSLVFAYGLDVFGTRVSPSFAFDVLGNSFNKIQLMLTVVALTVGVFVVGPFIKRKQTNALWQTA